MGLQKETEQQQLTTSMNKSHNTPQPLSSSPVASELLEERAQALTHGRNIYDIYMEVSMLDMSSSLRMEIK